MFCRLPLDLAGVLYDDNKRSSAQSAHSYVQVSWYFLSHCISWAELKPIHWPLFVLQETNLLV